MIRSKTPDVKLEDLRRDFGDEIAKLVDGVTKLTNLPNISRDDQHAEDLNGDGEGKPQPSDVTSQPSAVKVTSRKRDMASETLRKTFLAMGEDVRVILIKLADRLA